MQGSKLYVGNFSYSVNEEDLKEMFSSHGEVKEVKVIEGRGFGFVEMSSPSEAEKAKEALNGSTIQYRNSVPTFQQKNWSSPKYPIYCFEDR